MKTPKSPFLSRNGLKILFFCALPLLPQAGRLHAETRPSQDDTASSQLITNYLQVTGGKNAHRQLHNVVVEGTIKISTSQKNFQLIETNDGRRHLTYHWVHLGRNYRDIFVHDGLETWTQVLEPNKKLPKKYGGADGAHFASQHWLLHPFTLPTRADFVYKYQSTAKVSGRSAHLIKGFGKKNTESWFYFDQEKFLLTRWGGDGKIAGVKESLDYRATKFKSIDGILFPTEIDLVVENSTYGHIVIEDIKTNQNINQVTFLMPQSTVPTLRQRPAVRD